MALIVEDGTGLSSAESYVSVAQFKAYCEARGLTLPEGADDTAIEQALRRATDYIDGTYAARWPGRRVNAAQALAWPRAGASYLAGGAVPVYVLPTPVVAATSQAGLRELREPGALAPDGGTTAPIVQETVGPITTKYGEGATRPTFPIIEDLLAPLFAEATPGVGVVLLQRA